MNPTTNGRQRLVQRLCVAAAALFMALLSGCAARPLHPDVLNYYGDTRAKVSKVGSSVITDACLVRIEMGPTHFITGKSKAVGAELSKLAAARLTTLGVPVGRQLTPFACASALQGNVEHHAETSGATPERFAVSEYPFPNGDDIPSASRAAVAALMAAVIRAQPSVDNGAVAPAPVSLDLSEEQVARIRQLTESDYVWLVALAGAEVSTARKVAVGLLTAVVSVAASGGTMAAVSVPTDGMRLTTSLVNLDTRQLIWKGPQRRHSASPFADALAAGVADHLFSPFIPLPESKSAEPISAESRALAPPRGGE